VQEEVGVAVNAEFIERRIGTGAAQTFREILQNAGEPVDGARVKRLLAKKIQAEISMSQHVKLFPGAQGLLEALKGKIRLGLASMNNQPVIKDLLNTMKIRDCFEVVLTVEEVRRFKPDPEIFLKCAAKLQCKPEECVVVEDSIFGVEAARAGGMDCVAVLTGVYSRTELEAAKPDLIINSLSEREKILRFILR
jgi:beta-phosphoglucomutase